MILNVEIGRKGENFRCYLWCLDCGSELSVENPNCGHWLVCDECPEIDSDSECPECSYLGLESTCPRILKWKRKEETP